MPRKRQGENRGGVRTGTPGKLLPNRSDLRKPKPPALPKIATGLPYGEHVALERSTAAVPVAPPGPSTAPQGGAPAAPPAPIPGTLGDFARPSERPGEHVMAGAPTGPGPGYTPFGGGTPPLVRAAALLNAPAGRVLAGGQLARLRDEVNASLANGAAP